MSPHTTADTAVPLDWQGCPVDCAGCAHAGLQATGGCAPRVACVQDRYTRRIFAFFERNPELADRYLDHPYFEVRTLAARHVSVFRLQALLNDPEPDVRVAAVQRLPVPKILSLRKDPERKVRAAVAQRLTGADLVPLTADEDYYVRVVVARRLPSDILPMMMYDRDADVRRAVARRIGDEWLMAMAWDLEAEVRLQVAVRLSPEQLVALVADEDWRIRHVVASRAPLHRIIALATDPDEDVRARFALRKASEELPLLVMAARIKAAPVLSLEPASISGVSLGVMASVVKGDCPMSEDDEVEVYDDPIYNYGDKVVSTKNIRNDGTYPGAEIGEILVRKGDVGYVNSIGTFLQRYYIYGVDFYQTGRLVGMRKRELKTMEEQDMKITIRKSVAGDWEAYIAKKDLEAKIVAMENPGCWGGVITLDNGWRFQMPEMAADTRLPLTVEARKLAEEAEDACSGHLVQAAGCQ